MSYPELPLLGEIIRSSLVSYPELPFLREYYQMQFSVISRTPVFGRTLSDTIKCHIQNSPFWENIIRCSLVSYTELPFLGEYYQMQFSVISRTPLFGRILSDAVSCHIQNSPFWENIIRSSLVSYPELPFLGEYYQMQFSVISRTPLFGRILSDTILCHIQDSPFWKNIIRCNLVLYPELPFLGDYYQMQFSVISRTPIFGRTLSDTFKCHIQNSPFWENFIRCSFVSYPELPFLGEYHQM